MAGQWTVPWGRIEAGESPAAAALREVREEAGVNAEVEGLLGVQELPGRWAGWIALVYLCQHIDGNLIPMDSETDAAVYYSLSELDALNEPMEPWSDWLIRRVFASRYTLTRIDPTSPLQPGAAFL